MLRPIKFRGWIIPLYGEPYMAEDLFNCSRAYLDCSCLDFGEIINDERCSPMQFTGLIDKLHHEIYEGDIIEFEQYWYTYGASGTDKVRREVTWQDFYGAGWSFGKAEKDGEKRWSFPFPDCTIVGNIYENPELLTK